LGLIASDYIKGMGQMERILLVIHELTYTGAPVITKNIAAILFKNGYQVTVWSYHDGPYRSEFNNLGIKVKIVPPALLEEQKIKSEIISYDLVIANTSCTYEIVDLYQYQVPVVWLIHEAKSVKHIIGRNKRHYDTLKNAQNIYVVSEYAREFILNQYHKKTKVIHNYVEDEYHEYGNQQAKEKAVKFLALGSILENKAFDVFLKAFEMMDQSYREKCEMHLAGALPHYHSDYADELLSVIDSYDNIYYHGELQGIDSVMQMIVNSDVLVTVSRDEASSLVTLEGAMMGKPLIISCNVGAGYVVDQENGWIVETGNVDALRVVYQTIIDEPDKLIGMGKKSREKYLETSTYLIYEKEIVKLVKRHIRRSEAMFSIKNIPHHILNSIRSKKRENPYPFTEIEKGSRIVLYGAGKFGNRICEQIKHTHYYKLVLWVDQRNEECCKLGLNVENPQNIKKVDFDYILIAVLDSNLAREIKSSLYEQEIPVNKILWLPEYL
jgi:glycosyltransferase involved in cell wall biosynthesis